jgi:hypothetical protein
MNTTLSSGSLALEPKNHNARSDEEKPGRGSACQAGRRLFGRQVNRFDNSFERDFSGFSSVL